MEKAASTLITPPHSLSIHQLSHQFLSSVDSQRIFPFDPRHFILRIPHDIKTLTNQPENPTTSLNPKPRALQTLTTTPKCPTYPPPRPTWNSPRSYYKRTQTQ